jgi:hypothetical protein
MAEVMPLQSYPMRNKIGDCLESNNFNHRGHRGAEGTTEWFDKL